MGKKKPKRKPPVKPAAPKTAERMLFLFDEPWPILCPTCTNGNGEPEGALFRPKTNSFIRCPTCKGGKTVIR